MSFLNPWLWLGGLALGVPIWLHLRSRRGPVFAFPTLRFLEDQPRPRAHGVRLRDRLLFLARAAALLLIVAGFAWPYLESPAGRVTESRVHLLDNTLSRQADDAGFARDVGQIRAALASAPPDQQDAVIVLTSRPRVVAAFSDDRRTAAASLAALRPSFERGSYLEALRLAQSLLARSLGARRRILVYADHQQNQWSENETSPPFLERVEVELVRQPTQVQRPNLSVADPGVRRFFMGDEAFVDLAAELRHDGPFRRMQVRLLDNGKEVLKEDLALEGTTGNLTLRGQWPSDPAKWLRGELELVDTRDALRADDRIRFALPPLREGRVALLARSPYLRAALSPETMKGRWSTRRLDPAAAALGDLAEAEMPEVLVLEGDYAQSDEVRQLVMRCLNNERGVLLFLSRTTPLLQGFLRELGLETTASVALRQPEGFRFVATDHPVFKPFVRGELGDIMEPRLFARVGLSSPHAMPLVFTTSGAPVLLEGTATKGRLLVFAFAIDRRQTDWPLLPSFIPFLDLALQHARSATPLETSARPGELVVHEVPSDRKVLQVVLRAGGRELARAAVDASRKARLEAPADPGFYELGYDEDPAVRSLLAVNASPKESVLRYANAPAAVAAWTVPPQATAVAAGVDPRPGRRRALEQELWWWLLLAGALCLLVESSLLIARRGKSRPALEREAA